MKITTARCRFRLSLFGLLLLALPGSAAEAVALPSLFRGVIVADSSLGVRVVGIDEASQAYAADLRSDDLIVRVNEAEIHSIDDFAAVSNKLRGKIIRATIVIFRNGSPKQVILHLYSYPVLNAWGVEWVPEHDVRFAQPEIGRDHWVRLANGFETANQDQKALDAYFNALHNMPTDRQVAFSAAMLSGRLGQQQMKEGRFPDGLSSLRNSLLIMQKLFDAPLSDEQLNAIKGQLKATLEAIRQAPRVPRKT